MDAANSGALHDLNMNSIFRVIQHEASISRVGIVEKTGLAASTVSMITGELQESGFIRECGYATSTGGRRPRLLEVNPEGGYFICVDLAGSEIAIGVLNLSFQVVGEWSFEKTEAAGESLYKSLIQAIGEVLAWCGEHQLRVLSIGVAAPGLMDSTTGMILEASNLNWHDLKLDELLEQKFKLAAIVENDTNAAAYGEFLYGTEQAEQSNNMLYVAVGTGVGAGLIIDRALYKGSQGMAGEIGHVVVHRNGRVCTCGKKGCLETVAAERSLIRDYNSKSSEPVSNIQQLIQRSETGDDVAVEVLISAGLTLGVVVGNQINVLNVDTVVLGGDVFTRGRAMFEAVQEGLSNVLLPGFNNQLKVRVSSLNASAGYVGIAYSSLTSVLQKYGFKRPVPLDEREEALQLVQRESGERD